MESYGGGFRSVLFDGPVADRQLAPEEPDSFADLNLDQVLAALTAGREEYKLEQFFYSPLQDVAAVRYRQDVVRDLEQPEVFESVTRFAARMARMREHLAQSERLYYELQQQAWFVDAVAIYCEAVRSLSDDLERRELGSRGLRGLRDYLSEYVGSERFTSLSAETKAVKDAVAGVRYRVRINGPRVWVSRYLDDPDYSVEVLDTFARFRQGPLKSDQVALREHVEMNHIEAQILERVARLYPDVFELRARYCARHRDFLDPTIARFDREAQFCVGYLELIGRLRHAGLRFCYPTVSADSKELAVDAAFDLALAVKLVDEGRTVVCNDIALAEPERILVVTGPNNGGKTTFARTFGQLHHLGGLGLPIPGSRARLFLPDRIYTHFEREEEIETLQGKFVDELVRVHEILERATPSSVIVMNESFNSTTLEDALLVGTEVVRQILELGCLSVYVTFVDEIASLSESTVSMVSQIVPENPAQRTFKVLRKPADGFAYAWAIAEKYGLTYARLIERVSG